MQKKISTFIKSKKTLELPLGKIENLDQIGQGGNGLVYKGNMNGKEIAIKFLLETKETKLIRFKAEYFNVVSLQRNPFIVENINYGDLNLNDGTIIPYILMKKYDDSLKKIREPINWETFFNLYNFMKKSLAFIHSEGIIHRDLKPENILHIDKKKFALTDFGIASYNPELFKLKVDTKKGERLGNYQFSAPEQSEKGIKPSPSMDIYALGQICYWYAFGHTCKGTGLKSFGEVFDNPYVDILDSVVYKCLKNDPAERFQSVKELEDFEKKIVETTEKIDPFEEMRKLNKLIRSNFPECYNRPIYMTDLKRIKQFFDEMRNANFREKIWFSTGKANLDIDELIIIDEDIIRINDSEYCLNGVWCYISDSYYNDLLILDIAEAPPLEVDGNEVSCWVVTKDGTYITPQEMNCGYYVRENTVHKVEAPKFTARDIPKDSYYFIGTIWNSSIIQESDPILCRIQNQKLNQENVEKMTDPTYFLKHREVLYRL